MLLLLRLFYFNSEQYTVCSSFDICSVLGDSLLQTSYLLLPFLFPDLLRHASPTIADYLLQSVKYRS